MKTNRRSGSLVWALALAFCLPLGAQSGGPKAVPLRILVVATEAQAQLLRTRLVHGDDFAVLAKEYSTDPTAESGGYLGLTDPGTLRTELRDALAGAGNGGVSAVAHISSGYAILKVVSTESVADLEQVLQERAAAVAALGSIRYTPNVSGIGEAESALFRSAKPTGWGQDLAAVCASRRETLANATRAMEQRLDPSQAEIFAKLPPLDATQEYYALGELYAYPGEMDRAIAQYKKALELAEAKAPDLAQQLEEELGIAYLHKAEMENGIYHGQGDQCVFPLAPENAFQTKGTSREAIAYFRRYLEKVPEDLTARWLMNYAYMTVGEYPAGVPRKFVIPPAAFASKEPAPHFVDVAAAAGLHAFSMAGGVIVDDFENNGLLDVVTSSMNLCEHLHYFHNNGDGTFTDRSEQAGLMG